MSPIKAATAIPEEEWLVLYMRGKILEKQGKTHEPISFYFEALEWLDGYAQYPKKIPFKIHAGDYAHEALEIFYRINAVILKAYGKNQDLGPYRSAVQKLTQAQGLTKLIINIEVVNFIIIINNRT